MIFEGSNSDYYLCPWSDEICYGISADQSSNQESHFEIWQRPDELRQTSTIVSPFYAEGQKPEYIDRVDPAHEEILFRIEYLLQSCLQNIRSRLWGGIYEKRHQCCSHAEQRKLLEVEVKRVIKAASYLLDVTLVLQPFEIFLQTGYSSILIHLLDILSSVASHCSLSCKALHQSSTAKASLLELGMFENLAIQILLFLQALSKKNNSRFRRFQDHRNRIVNSTTRLNLGLHSTSLCTPKNEVTFSYGGVSLAIFRVASLLMSAQNSQIRYLATAVCFTSFAEFFEPNLQPEQEITPPISSLAADRLSLAFASLNHAMEMFQLTFSYIPALLGKHLNILGPFLEIEACEAVSPNDFISEWAVTTLRLLSTPSLPRISISKQLSDVIQFTKSHKVNERCQILCKGINSSRSTKEMSGALFCTMIEVLLIPEFKSSFFKRRSEWSSTIERIMSVPPSSSKDYDLLSHTLMFVSEVSADLAEEMLIKCIIPCAELLFNQSYPDNVGRNVHRALHSAQCAMISVFDGFFSSVVHQATEKEMTCLQLLRTYFAKKQILIAGMIAVGMASKAGNGQVTPRLRFGVFKILRHLLQCECLPNSEITRMFESLSTWITLFQRPTSGGLVCLDQTAHDALFLLKIASSALRRNMYEVTQISSTTEAQWLFYLLQDVNPIVKFSGLGIASDLVRRCFTTSGSQISQQSFQITQSAIKLAKNREESYAMQGASLNLLHAMIVNQRIFFEGEIMAKDLSCCQMWADQIKWYMEHVGINRLIVESAASDSFVALQATLSLVLFLRSVVEYASSQNIENSSTSVAQNLFLSGIILRLNSFLEIDVSKHEKKQLDDLDRCSSFLSSLCEILLQVKAAIFHLFSAIVCSSNDTIFLENISGCDLLKQVLRFLTCLEDNKVSSQSSYLFCFSSACKCLIQMLSKIKLSTSQFTLQDRQRMGIIVHCVLLHDRRMNSSNASRSVLALLQIFSFRSSDWLRDLLLENGAAILEELTLLFNREATHYSADDHCVLSCAYTVSKIWDLQAAEPISEAILNLALKTAREICAVLFKTTNFSFQSVNKVKASSLCESKDLMQVLTSLTILLSLVQLKDVRREICDPNLLSRLMSLFNLALEEYVKDLYAVKASITLGEKLLETSLLILCRLMWNEPTSKTVINGSDFTKRICDIALDTSSSGSFSPSLLNFSFAALGVLVLPDSSGRGSFSSYPTCFKVVASLKVWINLLKSPRTRKDFAASSILNARIVGGLKLLAVITLDGEGRRNAIFAWKDFEHLLNLITDFSRLLSNEMIRWSLLLLRNLSLDRSRKPVFLSHEAWMEFIINQCTSACEDNVVEAAYSALWCLLYQSQKAVSILKKNHRLDEILTRANQTGIMKAHRAVQILIQK